MHLLGAEHLSAREQLRLIGAGARCVRFELCISCLCFTWRRQTAIHWLAPGDGGLLRGLPYSLVTLLFGWWGLPWGLVQTPLALYTNCAGGYDVTPEVFRELGERQA
jgi:hypothetical protein